MWQNGRVTEPNAKTQDRATGKYVYLIHIYYLLYMYILLCML